MARPWLWSARCSERGIIPRAKAEVRQKRAINRPEVPGNRGPAIIPLWRGGRSVYTLKSGVTKLSPKKRNIKYLRNCKYIILEKR